MNDWEKEEGESALSFSLSLCKGWKEGRKGKTDQASPADVREAIDSRGEERRRGRGAQTPPPMPKSTHTQNLKL